MTIPRLRSALAAAAICALAAPAGSSPWRDDCGLEPPRAFPPVPRKPGGAPAGARAERFTRPAVRHVRLGPTGQQAEGALSGKTVYVSAGHGWTWAAGAWRTQRGNTNGLVEDLVSAEAIDQYLLAYLRNMGAYVVPIRESDLNPERVVVDDGDAVLEGGAVERAGAADAGWGEVPLPITDQTNPFAAGGTRLLETAAAERGRAVYAAAIPASAYYNVYVSYAQGPDRAPDAHYVVRHAGGESHFRVDQRRHGSTWVLLGNFWFEAGAPAERASVAVADDSEAAGAVVSLDAVRWGGGVGVIDRGGGANGRPMYENNARYNAQLNGAPAAVYDYADTDGGDDVGTRSRFAAWDHEDGEDAVYLSWHTNAPNPGRGTESYSYGPNGPPSPLSEFSGTAGSRELQDAVHFELIGDLRAGWDASWPDRGRFTAWFGEVNPSHNPETPAILVEIAFHDTPADADALRDPRFRRLAARAMAQGVARYFAERDGAALVLPPEPPTAVRVQNDGAGGLVVAWRPPAADPAGGDAADAYRVYVSGDGFAWDDGTPVDAESFVLPNLGAGAARYVRVAATNAGGESLPSEVVGARVAASGAASVLVVGGFDRLDGAQLPVEDLSAYDLAVVDRMWLDRVNDGSYAARHGAAITAAGASFDGGADEAVEQEDVDLAAYAAVDWFLGEESSGDEPLGAAARAALTAYLAGGGRLFVSGSEIGWAMDFLGLPEEQAFYRDVLHTTYVGDDAETYDVAALEGPYGGLQPFSFGDPARGAYDPEWPDVLDPGAGAAVALDYVGGAGGHAAIIWGGAGPGERGVVFGFPFETIEGADRRAEVMDRTLAYLAVEDEPQAPDAGPGGDDPAGGCGCRAAGHAGGSGLVWAAALLAALDLRRRRRHTATPCPSPRPERASSPPRR